MSSSLNKVAIITGAAQGIGRSIALRLVKDGYHVAINDLPEQRTALESLAKEIKQLSNDTTKVRIAIANIMGEEEVEQMAVETVEELGELWVVSLP